MPHPVPPLFHTPPSQTRELCYDLDQALQYKHIPCLQMEDFTSDVSQNRGWSQGKKVKCYVDMTIHQNHQYNTASIK